MGVSDAKRSRVFGLPLCSLTQEELIDEILKPDQSGLARLVATVNVDHVVTLRTDVAFQDAYRSAWRITADGAPVYLYAKVVGLPLKERITGADLFAELVLRWDPMVHRLFLLVSNDEVADRIRETMVDRKFSNDNLTIEVAPLGFDSDEAFGDRLASNVRDFGATHLIMAVGAPKSEIWAYHHRDSIGNATVLCVGAAVEFVTGLKVRSPVLMRRFGMEWFWRFLLEPRRLFSRYFVRSFGFFLAVADDQRRERTRG